MHAIQTRRRELGCKYTDRIAVAVVTDDADLRRALEEFRDYILRETLTVKLTAKAIDGAEPAELTLGGKDLTLYLKVVPQ